MVDRLEEGQSWRQRDLRLLAEVNQVRNDEGPNY